MSFSRAHLVLFLSLVLVGGCRRSVSPEEMTTRRAVREALHGRAFNRAVPLARKVLDFAPNDDGAWARLAQAQLGARDLTGLRQTLGDWRSAVKKRSAKYDELRGDLARAEGRQAEALSAWKEAVAHRDREPRVFIKIARLQQANGHWKEAVIAWTQAMQNQPSAPALITRATCYRHLHDWEAARADLERAARIAPDDRLVRQERALLDRLGKFLVPIRDLDHQLKALPNDAFLLADRALLFLRAGDPSLALDDARQAARLAPGAVRPKLFRAIAEGMLGHAANPAISPAVLRLESLSSDFLQTISRLDAEIAAEPKSAELLSNRAWQLNEIGQPKLALTDAETALENDPKSAGAWAEASYALAKLKRASEAYERIKQATTLDPNFSTAWQYRGELEIERADYLGAIDSLTRALAISQTAAALARREECYRKLGLLAKAEDDHRVLEQLKSSR
jgi:tetratricopeptide (TPR) repeat protein